MIRQWLHNWKIQRHRRKVFNAVKEHPEGVAALDIVKETGYDIRRVNAILIVLTKNGLISTIYTDKGRRWRAI